MHTYVLYLFYFSGLALLLPHCPHVDFIEYIPSTRLNGRCHYYSKEVRGNMKISYFLTLAVIAQKNTQLPPTQLTQLTFQFIT